MSNQKRFALIGSGIGPIDKSDDLADGDILVYDASTGKWVSEQLSASSITITESQIIDGAILARVASAEAITGAWTFSTAAQIELLGGTGLWIRDAGTLRVHDSTDVDYIELAHDGTVSLIRDVNSSGMYLSNSSGLIAMWRSGTAQSFRIYDLAGTDYGQQSHDGTDYNWAFVNTADLNITGLTRMDLQAALNVTGAAAFGSTVSFQAASIADAALSANVPLLNAANTFLTTQAIAAASNPAFTVTDTTTNAQVYIQATDTLGIIGTSSAHNLSIVAGDGTQRAFFAADGSEFQVDVTLLDFNGAADFSSTVTVASTFSLNSSAILHSAATPYHLLSDTSAAANNGKWLVQVNSGFRVRATNDATDTFTDPIVISRSDQTITEVELNATTLDFNGNLDVSGTATFGGTGLLLTNATNPTFQALDTTNNVSMRMGALDTTGYSGTISAHQYSLYTDNVVRAFFAADGSEFQVDVTTIDVNGLLDTQASATGGAGLRIPHGAAPTSPVDGDMWTTTSGLFVRINGSTVGPLS